MWFSCRATTDSVVGLLGCKANVLFVFNVVTECDLRFSIEITDSKDLPPCICIESV